MFDSLLEQIPVSLAVAFLVLMVSFNFFFGVIRLIYLYYSKKGEQNLTNILDNKIDSLTKELKSVNKNTMKHIDEIEKSTNNATSQIGVILAHYESEVKFRKMLEDKVNNIEKKIAGNGNHSMETEIQLLKQKVDSMSHKIEILNSKENEKDNR